jgi:serine/threonine-protein kinase
MARRRGTLSHEAYDLYLKGHFYLNRRRPGLEGASRSFQAAIDRDPGFGRAYAGLANSLALLRYFGETALEVQPVIDHARRALAIDSTLADAHVALGILYMSIGRLAAADSALRTAIKIEPGNSAAHFQLGRCLTYLGRVDDAIAAFERAKGLEPYQATTATWLGYLLTYGGDAKRAHDEAMRAWDLDSSSAVVQMFASMTALEAGRPADALQIVRSSPVRNALTRGPFAYVLGKAQHPDSSRATIAEIEGRRASLWNDYVNLAIAALAVTDTARALDALEKAAARNEPVFAFFPLSSEIYDSVRDTPRFAALMRRVDVPGYHPIRRR